MRYLIMLLSLYAYSIQSYATCDVSQVTESRSIDTTVPKHLKGAKIIVKQADGTESVIRSEEFKVVPRKQERLITKETVTCVQKSRRNRVSLVAGRGPKPGLDYRSEGNSVEVESRVGLVGGVMYQRELTDRWSIGVQVLTSKTLLGVVGYDF